MKFSDSNMNIERIVPAFELYMHRVQSNSFFLAVNVESRNPLNRQGGQIFNEDLKREISFQYVCNALLCLVAD